MDIFISTVLDRSGFEDTPEIHYQMAVQDYVSVYEGDGVDPIASVRVLSVYRDPDGALTTMPTAVYTKVLLIDSLTVPEYTDAVMKRFHGMNMVGYLGLTSREGNSPVITHAHRRLYEDLPHAVMPIDDKSMIYLYKKVNLPSMVTSAVQKATRSS